MIEGRHDTWYTIDEFAAMIGRDAKTVRNWASKGKLRFAHLCGVPLVSMRMVENLIEGRVATGRDGGEVARRLIAGGVFGLWCAMLVLAGRLYL